MRENFHMASNQIEVDPYGTKFNKEVEKRAFISEWPTNFLARDKEKRGGADGS